MINKVVASAEEAIADIPDGASLGRVAARWTTSAACSAVSGACWRLAGVKSVCTKPGHTDVTLMGVSASALARAIVMLLSAALDDW